MSADVKPGDWVAVTVEGEVVSVEGGYVRFAVPAKERHFAVNLNFLADDPRVTVAPAARPVEFFGPGDFVRDLPLAGAPRPPSPFFVACGDNKGEFTLVDIAAGHLLSVPASSVSSENYVKVNMTEPPW